MKIELHLARAMYVQGEGIDVDVYLTNTGTVPVAVPLPGESVNWQPVYSLTGPGTGAPVAFSYRSVRFKTAGHEGAVPAVENLAPGKQFAHGFTLNQWQDLSRPGAYTLRCSWEWNGLRAEAQPVTFEIAANTFVAASAAAPAGVAKARTIDVAWLGEGTGGKSKAIGRTVYYLKRPDLGELTLQDMRLLRTAPAAAVEPVVVSANFDPVDVPLLRFGWREGGAVYLAAGLESPPARADLGSEAARIVQPALASRNGRVCLFALTDKRLSLVTFTAKPNDPLSLDSSVAPVAEFPAPADAAAATLAPEKLGSGCHLVAAGESGDGLVLMHWAEAGGVGRLEVPGVLAWRSSQPAVHIDPDGTVHAALVVRRSGVGFTLALLTAAFGTDGTPKGVPGLSDLPRLEDAVDSAAAAFDSAAETAGQPAWAIALKNGRIVHAASHSGIAMRMAPARPLQLILFHSQPFVLMLDALHGPKLEPLD